jgi:hypothetical protein
LVTTVGAGTLLAISSGPVVADTFTAGNEGLGPSVTEWGARSRALQRKRLGRDVDGPGEDLS